ncbi:uncharacterized protein E0L32_011392 [Thyridium curvatum]|uniref:Uncharacterized protein n=1 Tax=Thyridium curvatum TaxID=1093900 RepID=A0A507BJB9_9PEZI|nr:uncharacterized protein E0L32_011392 [Thyridium curvatum]TPX18914.1 hypothetical protein E0L32_011392 [Thyridium curvatum]
MNTAGVIILVLVLFLVGGAVGWVLFTRWRAQRLGVSSSLKPLVLAFSFLLLSAMLAPPGGATLGARFAQDNPPPLSIHTDKRLTIKTQRNKQLPPPSWSSFIPFVRSEPSYGVQPARGGVVGWFNDQVRKFRNRNNRSAAGAYEGASGVGGASAGGGSHVGTGRQGRAGFGPLDPDDAWDARVGAEADMYGPSSYYEEQELGSHPQHGGSSYAMNLARDEEEMGAGGGQGRRGRTGAPGTGGGRANPFEDDAEPSNMSLRGVSPRPIDTSAAAATPAKKGGPKDGGSAESSPTERRSVFRENV